MNSFTFFEMYITAAIPYIRDIIKSGHNERTKEHLLFAVTKMSEKREQIHIFSNCVSNIFDVVLPFKLIRSSRISQKW